MRATRRLAGVIAATAAMAAGGPTLAQPGQCFRSSDWAGWKASRDASVLLIGAGPNRVFRLELDHPCPELHDIGARLLTISRGGGWICQAKDIDMRVLRSGMGGPTYCPVKRMTRLYPSEVRALPRDLRP